MNKCNDKELYTLDKQCPYVFKNILCFRYDFNNESKKMIYIVHH